MVETKRRPALKAERRIIQVVFIICCDRDGWLYRPERTGRLPMPSSVDSSPAVLVLRLLPSVPFRGRPVALVALLAVAPSMRREPQHRVLERPDRLAAVLRDRREPWLRLRRLVAAGPFERLLWFPSSGQLQT